MRSIKSTISLVIILILTASVVYAFTDVYLKPQKEEIMVVEAEQEPAAPAGINVGTIEELLYVIIGKDERSDLERKAKEQAKRMVQENSDESAAGFIQGLQLDYSDLGAYWTDSIDTLTNAQEVYDDLIKDSGGLANSDQFKTAGVGCADAGGKVYCVVLFSPRGKFISYWHS